MFLQSILQCVLQSTPSPLSQGISRDVPRLGAFLFFSGKGPNNFLDGSHSELIVVFSPWAICRPALSTYKDWVPIWLPFVNVLKKNLFRNALLQSTKSETYQWHNWKVDLLIADIPAVLIMFWRKRKLAWIKIYFPTWRIFYVMKYFPILGPSSVRLGWVWQRKSFLSKSKKEMFATDRGAAGTF